MENNGKNYWIRQIETADRQKIREIQSAKLQRMVDYTSVHSRFYSSKFKHEKVSISKIKTVEDIQRLPFTTRDEIVADQERYGGLGSLMATKWTDPGQTIGLTGVKISYSNRPIRMVLSLHDSAFQGKLGARGLIGAGITAADFFYLADFPQFNPIFMNMGLSSINAGSKVLSVGMERAERNATIFPRLYPPAAYFINPSYSKFVVNIIEKEGKKLPIRTVVGWGEPGYSIPSVRERHQRRWAQVSSSFDVKVCDVYAMVELGILGFECRQQTGLHAFEDGYIYEVVDPQTGSVLPAGEEGELVVTHLERKGMPLLRYRTGDITAIDDSPCTCGRTHVRLQGIKGRYGEIPLTGGKRVYASQVENIIGKFPQYAGGINVFRNGSQPMSQIDVVIAQEGLSEDDAPAIKKALEDELKVPAKLTLVKSEDLIVFPHRAHRVLDRTKLELYKRETAEQFKGET